MAEVELVPTDREHIAAIQRLAGHPGIAAMTPIPYPYPEGAARRFVENVVLPARAAGTAYGFAIMAEGEMVGHIGLKHVDRAQGEAELGYWIGRPFWSRGYASAAGREALAFAFGALGLTRIYAHVLAHNPASARVLEKLGFAAVELPPEAIPCACASKGETLGYALHRDAWKASGG